MKRIALTAFVCLLSAGAAAGDFRFHYSPQDLAAPEGVEQLHARLEIAAGAYCRDQYITLNVHKAQQCRRDLVEQAVQQIGNARLAAHQEDRAGQSG